MKRLQEPEKEERATPVHFIRHLSVWANYDDKGRVRHAVTFCRLSRYGDEWGTSYSYGIRDLPLLDEAADAAFKWIAETIGTDTPF